MPREPFERLRTLESQTGLASEHNNQATRYRCIYLKLGCLSPSMREDFRMGTEVILARAPFRRPGGHVDIAVRSEECSLRGHSDQFSNPLTFFGGLPWLSSLLVFSRPTCILLVKLTPAASVVKARGDQSIEVRFARLNL